MPAAMSAMNIGMKNGRDLARPALAVDVVLLLEALQPADAAAEDDAGRVGVVAVAVVEPGVVHRLHRRGDRVLRVQVGALRFLPLHVLRADRSPSPRRRTAPGNFVASNFVIGAAPDSPSSSARQVVATSLPTGVMAPRPVTTTRRLHYAPTFSFR